MPRSGMSVMLLTPDCDRRDMACSDKVMKVELTDLRVSPVPPARGMTIRGLPPTATQRLPLRVVQFGIPRVVIGDVINASDEGFRS